MHNNRTKVYSVARPGRPTENVTVTEILMPEESGPVYTVSINRRVIGTLTTKETPSGRTRFYGHRTGDKAARVAESRMSALRGILDRHEKAEALERINAAKPAPAAPEAPQTPPADADPLRAELEAARQEYADADALRQKAITRRRTAVSDALDAGLSQAECAALLGVSRQFVEKLSGAKS